MAQKAKKDRAKSNAAALANLHLGAFIVNATFLLAHFFFRSRSLVLYLVLSLPSFLCELFLERAGRPRYDSVTGALRTSGEDLGAAGLTEYLFDVIWVTWGTAVAVILFGNKLWLLFAVVPAYGAYKGYGLLGATRQMAAMQGLGGAGAGAGSGGGGGGGAPSRRQRRAA
ncbi:DUF788 domain containing protein [Niveomyces insectorum RCEF 264]|uniref:DUF788 domain containing protein n=1 Tax=Niveomyces insectorum RCEF 264 TaxID=1081102 RepID=A0A167Y2E2_9HYPO|nr:DUF788 domain containing protein [Niveomyces insectorum RCEF 264]